MIIRPRQKRTLVQRIFRPMANAKSEVDDAILSQAKFELELAKEAARVNRCPGAERHFSVVSILTKSKSEKEQVVEFVYRFRNGLRLTDSVGWLQNRLSLLLPETNVDGAAEVANQMTKLAAKEDINLETDIRTYPKDDELVQRANDLIEELAGIGKVVSRMDSGGIDSSDDDDLGSSGDAASDAKKQTAFSNRMDKVSPANFNRFSTPLESTFKTPWWKRGIDIVCSGSGLVALSPVFLVTAIAIKRNSSGPVFFKQRREGKDGKVFEILKFRTMGVDAESLKDDLRSISEQDGPAFKLENDPRVTTVGKYLRKSCIDELPQLMNVFKGDMSLVGPRPLPIDESVQCSDWQRHRLRVLPGITCIWQAEGGRDTQFDDWMRMDLQYLRERSFVFDIKMIFKTVFIAVLHKGSV